MDILYKIEGECVNGQYYYNTNFTIYELNELLTGILQNYTQGERFPETPVPHSLKITAIDSSGNIL